MSVQAARVVERAFGDYEAHGREDIPILWRLTPVRACEVAAASAGSIVGPQFVGCCEARNSGGAQPEAVPMSDLIRMRSNISRASAVSASLSGRPEYSSEFVVRTFTGGNLFYRAKRYQMSLERYGRYCWGAKPQPQRAKRDSAAPDDMAIMELITRRS